MAVALGLGILVAGPVGAQPKPPAARPTIESYFRRIIDREQGLPEVQINAIAQTRDGYLWLGTRRGLVRYDGLAFTTYSPDNTPAIPGYWINGLSVDRRDRLWIATREGLVVKEDTGFRRIDSSQVNGPTWDVLEDTQGRIWVATQAGVLVGDGHRFRPLPGAAGYTYGFTRDSRGRVWMAGRGFLAFSDGDSVVDVTPLFRDARRFFDVMADGPDRIWVGTQVGAIQLALDGEGNPTIARMVPTNADGKERPVWSLGRTPDGAIWLGTATDGTMMWDGQLLRSLPANSEETWSFLVDRRGLMWVGTAAGLERYQQRAFTNLITGLPRRSVWSVRADERGAMWAGLANGAVYRWAKSGFEEELPGPGTVTTVPIWPTPGGMLVAQNGRPLAVARHGTPLRTVAAAGLPPGDVYGLFRESSGAVWVSADSGLFRIDRGRARRLSDSLGLPRTATPRDIVVDSAGRLLLGDPGLTVVDHGRVRHYGLADGLTDPRVNALYPRGDQVWIVTADSGLFLLQHDRVMSLSHLDPQLHQELIAITEDDLGYLWLVWRHGLLRVARRALEQAADGVDQAVEVRTFDAIDGLGINSFEMDYQRAIAKDSVGRLWLPGTVGVLLVDPRRVLVDSTPPQVHLERLLIDGKERAIGGPVTLPAGVGRVEITFAATDVAFPRRVRLQFRLVGLDRAWQDAGQRRTASFGPLRGGEYRFEVRAASEEGRWSPSVGLEVRVALTLAEHPWFLPVLVLGTVAIVVLIARVRQRALVRRGHELTELVKVRTEDLEAARATLERRVDERTAQLAAELAERLRLEQQLVQAQKLEGLGRLAGGVAHEINNNMTAVLGFTELATQGSRNREDISTDLAEVRRAGERVAAITRQLLTFARRHQTAPTALGLSEVLEQMGRALRQAVGERIAIETVIAPALHPIHADQSQIEQVVLNLVLNARDAIADRGTITLRADPRRLATNHLVGATNLVPGDYLVLSVTDTGAGMTEEVQARLFEPFFTTKGVNRGTGLGLAVCHGIVTQHLGAIGVESVPGKGTTFQVWLPASSEPSVAAPTAEPEPTSGNETILVVEDDPFVREVVEQLLATCGYRVMVAGDGAEALALIEGRIGDIDLVLTDVMMPVINGVELVRALRSRRGDLPVVFMSGFTGHDATLEEELNGLGPLMPKPFSSEVIAATVRRVLDRRQSGLSS